jgi:hypothetical protein
MAINTPKYPGDTRWAYFKRVCWLTWDNYLSPFGPKHSTQWINERMKPHIG